MAYQCQDYVNEGYETDIDEAVDTTPALERQYTLNVANWSDASPPQSCKADSLTDASAPADVTRNQEHREALRAGGLNRSAQRKGLLHRDGAAAAAAAASSSALSRIPTIGSVQCSPRNISALYIVNPSSSSEHTSSSSGNSRAPSHLSGVQNPKSTSRSSSSGNSQAPFSVFDVQNPSYPSHRPTIGFELRHPVALPGREAAVLTAPGDAENLQGRGAGHVAFDEMGFSRSKAKRIAQRCCVVWFVLTAVAIVAAILLIFLPTYAARAVFYTTGTVHMRVKEPFHEDLLDLTTTIAVNYTTRLCTGTTAALKSQSEVDEVQRCEVLRLSNGSVRVLMNLQLKMHSNISWSDFEQNVLRKSGRLQGDVRMFSDIPVIPDSIRVTNFSTTESDESATDTAVTTTTTTTTTTAMTRTTTTATTRTTTTTTAETNRDPQFDCSVGGELYKPYNNTYPFNCGLYQRCENGQSIHQHCERDLEFGYDSGSTLGPCRYPSNGTYCGRKRLENSSMTSLRMTTAMTSSLTMTSPTTPDPCSGLDPLILNNSTSLYSCMGLEPQSYRPLEDTYPHRCDEYQWCQNGLYLNVTHCAEGAHFVYGGDTQESCDAKGSSRTFCEQMKLAESCR